LVKKLPRFEIRILTPSHCRLRRVGDDWQKEFLSVKGALDFVGCLPGSEAARITITDPTGERRMRIVW